MLFDADNRVAAEAIAELCYTNPFTPKRIELEQRALGAEFREVQSVWNRSRVAFRNPNVRALRQRAAPLLHAAHRRLEAGTRADADELSIYAGLARYHLHERFGTELAPLVERVVAARLSSGQEPIPNPPSISVYREFREEAERWYGVRELFPKELSRVPHLFATSVQVRLAFSLIYQSLLGSSRAAADLRAATWRSIFTADMRRYERVLFAGMHEIPTLVLGESGTGKELVARAIGLSPYVPFKGEDGRFAVALASDFHALNLSAMSASLIESELFGHSEGAFTGATRKRTGYFEACSRHGAVFLDEVGDLDPGIQVKLLRVLQSRQVQRLGDTESGTFEGRVLAATHRDLTAGVETGRFRHDLYYRLCAHTITTPSLAEQLAEAPDDLHAFVENSVERVLSGALGGVGAPDPNDTEALTHDVVRFIEQRLGRAYPWPGNVRELEQCVRSYLVQLDYTPAVHERPPSLDSHRAPAQSRTPAPTDLEAALGHTTLTADALLNRYCALTYARLGSLRQTAKLLGLNRKTVTARLAQAQAEADEAAREAHPADDEAA